MLLQAGKSRSPQAFQCFAAISFDDFNLAGWEEGRSVCSCAPSNSLKDNCIPTFKEDFHSINKCLSQRSMIQMRRVPVLPPKVWTALTVLWHSTSPLLSPSVCFALTAWVPERFSPFFSQMCFPLWLFFLSYVSPVILNKMTTVRPTVFESNKCWWNDFACPWSPLLSVLVPFTQFEIHFQMCHLGWGRLFGLRMTPSHIKSLNPCTPRANLLLWKSLAWFADGRAGCPTPPNSHRYPLRYG